jgi:hypothetical protein
MNHLRRGRPWNQSARIDARASGPYLNQAHACRPLAVETSSGQQTALVQACSVTGHLNRRDGC